MQNANEVGTSVPEVERHFFSLNWGRKGQKLDQKDITYLRSPAAVLTVRIYLQVAVGVAAGWRAGECRCAALGAHAVRRHTVDAGGWKCGGR